METGLGQMFGEVMCSNLHLLKEPTWMEETPRKEGGAHRGLADPKALPGSGRLLSEPADSL